MKFENKGKWVRESFLKNESKQTNESKVNMAKLKAEIQNAIKTYFKNDKDILEYVYVETKKDKFGRDILEVRAELGYNAMVNLADYLDKIVRKYDRYAYFDQETSGIMTAVFESSQKSLKPESIEDDKRRLDLEIKLQQQKIMQLGRDGASQERYKKAKEKLEKLQDKRNKLNESSQKNETRGYKVLVELGVPDSMNNRDIEDEVERLLRTSHKIDVVMDVTATRR